MTLTELRAELERTVLHRQLGLELVAAERGRVTLTMPLNPLTERLPATGQFHGGAIATLIDTAGDMALMAELGHGVPTIDLRLDYLRPAGGERLTAEAFSRRVGRTLAVVDVEVTGGDGRLVAIGRGCYSSKAG